MKFGANNFGKSYIGATPYTDVAVRYAHLFSNKLAVKVNVQAINGTDFIADDYNDRSHRDRPGFFVDDKTTQTVSLGYVRNNDPLGNFQYDGVNIYGDDFSNGGAVSYAAGDTTASGYLRGKTITRTGYTEYDLTGDKAKVFSYRANAAIHYKITDKIEAIGDLLYEGSCNVNFASP